MSKKFYRLIVILLSSVLLLTILSTTKNYFSNQQRINNNKNLIIDTKDNGNVEVTNNIDDTTLRVNYDKNSDRYTLYRNDVKYDLSTKKYNNDLVIDLTEVNNQNYDGVVVGQCPLVIPIILWTPALIEAAQITISATVAVVGTYTVWYSVDSIAKTIDESNVDTKVKENTKDKKNNAYYAAVLINNKVSINRQLTYTQALDRLIAGEDVFATNEESARAVTMAATLTDFRYYYHDAHQEGEGFYPHYHPGGRKWYKNRNYLPHCWFAPAP